MGILVGVALQALAIAIMFFLHDLTPFHLLLLQWLTNGSAWLFLVLACYRAGLVDLRIDGACSDGRWCLAGRCMSQVFLYLLLRVDQVLGGGCRYRQPACTRSPRRRRAVWLLPTLAAALIRKVQAGRR